MWGENEDTNEFSSGKKKRGKLFFRYLSNNVKAQDYFIINLVKKKRDNWNRFLSKQVVC